MATNHGHPDRRYTGAWLVGEEWRLVAAAADAEGLTVSALVRQTLLPEAMRRLARAAATRGLAR